MTVISEQIYIVSQLQGFASDDELQGVIEDWLYLARLLLMIETAYVGVESATQAFDLNQISTAIQEINFMTQEEIILDLKSSLGEFHLQYYQGVLRERILLDGSIFAEQDSLIIDYLNKRMERHGVFAYVRSLEEYLSHNIQSLSDREEDELTFPHNLPKMYNEKQEIIVDCSQLAGFDVSFRSLCLTSCWKMWVTAAYYHFIPKKAFVDVQQVESVEELANNVVQITLYESPLEWRKKRNIAFQYLYRDQLGFDQFEWSNGVGVLREPHTEFVQLGNRTQMIQYQNSSLQPTIKSQARHFTTHLYGMTELDYIEGRRFGQLNERAYFPWQDVSKKTMLAYLILNPLYTLDSGVNAFSFYIQQYLDAKLKSESGDHYQAILRFYVPGELLSGLPLDELTASLGEAGVDLKKQRRTKNKGLLLLESKVRQLKVEFLDVAELDKAGTTSVGEREIISKTRQRLKKFLTELKKDSSLT